MASQSVDQSIKFLLLYGSWNWAGLSIGSAGFAQLTGAPSTQTTPTETSVAVDGIYDMRAMRSKN